jgi:hypothetical protein
MTLSSRQRWICVSQTPDLIVDTTRVSHYGCILFPHRCPRTRPLRLTLRQRSDVDLMLPHPLLLLLSIPSELRVLTCCSTVALYVLTCRICCICSIRMYMTVRATNHLTPSSQGGPVKLPLYVRNSVDIDTSRSGSNKSSCVFEYAAVSLNPMNGVGKLVTNVEGALPGSLRTATTAGGLPSPLNQREPDASRFELCSRPLYGLQGCACGSRLGRILRRRTLSLVRLRILFRHENAGSRLHFMKFSVMFFPTNPTAGWGSLKTLPRAAGQSHFDAYRSDIRREQGTFCPSCNLHHTVSMFLWA